MTMQLLTVVYRYGEDCYLLAADGGLIDSYQTARRPRTPPPRSARSTWPGIV